MGAPGERSPGATRQHSLLCWGYNVHGEVGISAGDSALPAPVPGGPFDHVRCGGHYTCAWADADGSVHCWGDDSSGQLGDGMTTPRSTPMPVAGLPPVKSLSTGPSHACAVTTADEVWCWGSSYYGQAASKDTGLTPAPVQVLGLP